MSEYMTAKMDDQITGAIEADSETLLPCPFCGNPPAVDPEGFVACFVESCGAYLSSPSVAEWNTRAESPELATLRADLARVTQERDNLLARIHRDGGHYLAEHGAVKAVADADAIVATTFAKRDALQGAIDELVSAKDAFLSTGFQPDREVYTASVRLDAAHSALTALANPPSAKGE